MNQTKRYKQRNNGTRKRDGGGRKIDPYKKIQDATQKIIQNPQTQEVRSKANLKSAGWTDEEIDEFYKQVYMYFNEQPINTLSKVNAKRVGISYQDPLLKKENKNSLLKKENKNSLLKKENKMPQPLLEKVEEQEEEQTVVEPVIESVVEPVIETVKQPIVEPVIEQTPSLLEKDDFAPLFEKVDCDYDLEPDFAGLNCDNENFYSN
jgi:hypothetical protein